MSFDLRLVVPAAVGWSVSLALIFLPHYATLVATVSWCAACVLSLIAVLAPPVSRRRGVRAVWRATGFSLVVVALLATAIAAALPARQPTELSAAAAGAEAVELDVRLDAAPRTIKGGEGSTRRWWLVGTAVSVVVHDKRTAVQSPVVVFGPSGAKRSQAGAIESGSVLSAGFGDTVTVRGRLRATEPGEKAAFLLSATANPTLTSGAPPWLSWADPLRASFALAAQQLPGDGGALLPGLSIGDVSAVDERLDVAMKTSALTHVTAVSGAHCSLVTGLVFVLAAAIGLGRRCRAMVALVALSAYVVLVTPDSSVVRAGIMATIVLCSLAGGRPGRGLPTLGLAVIVLLLLDPWKAVDYGFALSVLATGGLLVLTGPLVTALSRYMPVRLSTVIALPLAAQIACQPVLILLDPSLPLYGIAANLLVEPAVPIATIGGLAACLVLPFIPLLGMALAWLAWLPAAWIAQVALTLDAMPASRLPWVSGVIGLLLAAIVLVLVAIRVMTPLGRKNGWLSVLAIVGLIGGAGVYAGSVAGAGMGDRLALPDNWQIAACDVGQGDAVIVRDGDKHAIVDVGRHPEAIAGCLDRFGIERLDLAVLTHYDVDHIGGIAAIVGKVDLAIVGRKEEKRGEDYVERLRRGGAQVVQGVAGLGGRMGELDWSIVWPVADRGLDEVPTGNDGSVTVEFEGRGVRSIYLGDLGERVQDGLLATSRVRPVDVVKVAHHGSADQSEALYRQLQAKVGVISVGATNGYGHPTRKLLDILDHTGTAALRTDRQGLIVLSPAPDGVTIWTERDDVEPADAGRAASDRGGTYAGTDEGGSWQHEARQQAVGARQRQARSRWRRSRSSPGTLCDRLPSCSFPAPRAFWPSVRSARSVISSRAKIPVSKSAISRRTTMRPAN